MRFDGGPIDERVVRRMTRTLDHRGPDGSGYHFGPSLGMGFKRLAILDLSPAGDQPMSTPDGRQRLVYNGELYNYVELREELRDLGYRFRSTGDTEVLLYSLLRWGDRSFEKFNGMWALALWDEADQSLLLSRDRFGIKPLYVYRERSFLLAASEIKSILASGLYSRGVNWRRASNFLARRRLDDDMETLYEGITCLPPGTSLRVSSTGGTSSTRFWDLEVGSRSHVSDPPGQFAALFEDAVRLRLRSDVPVGVSLSGGLDSTSVVCSVARQMGREADRSSLHAFCYQSPDHDERAYIAATIRRTEAILNELETDPLKLWERLETYLWYQDEPVHSFSPVIGFELMGLASSAGVPVILNGQGADEVLGGYAKYFSDLWFTRLRRGRVAAAWKSIQSFSAAHGGDEPRVLLERALTHLVLTELRRFGPYRRWLSRKKRQRASHPWYDPALTQCLPAPHVEYVSMDLDNVLKRSIEVLYLPLYLRIEDRNSMAHSVEARVPFLDHRLVELAFRLSADWKLRGPLNKYLLREAMRGRIPEVVRLREDKMGFPTPMGRWFVGPLGDVVLDLLGERAVEERGIYRIPRIREDLARHRRGEIDASQDLFNLLQFEIWMRNLQSSMASLPGFPQRSEAAKSIPAGQAGARVADGEAPDDRGAAASRG